MLIIYFNKLSKNRDLLFESQCSLSLKYTNEVYAYMINIFFRKVQVRNDIDQAIIISRKIKLKMLDEYEQNKCFSIEP